MKTKNYLKILLIFATILIVMCLFNTNVVKATAEEDTERIQNAISNLTLDYYYVEGVSEQKFSEENLKSQLAKIDPEIQVTFGEKIHRVADYEFDIYPCVFSLNETTVDNAFGTTVFGYDLLVPKNIEKTTTAYCNYAKEQLSLEASSQLDRVINSVTKCVGENIDIGIAERTNSFNKKYRRFIYGKYD